MKFAKACLALLALALGFSNNLAHGAVAYSNLPASPPFYYIPTGSSIYGSLQDPTMTNTPSTIAMSWVSSQTGTLSSLTLGLTFLPGASGSVNIFLGENPTPVGGFNVFASLGLLGQVTTTDQFGTTDSGLTTLATPAPLPIFSGNTYYLILSPADPNTSVMWHENVTGATSSYYFSTDMGATFTLAGVFGSDALQLDVDVTAIPEASTWISGALLAGLLGFGFVRRRVAAR